MVQILLAEVQLDDTFEWGTELGLQDSLLFDRNSATGGTLATPVSTWVLRSIIRSLEDNRKTLRGRAFRIRAWSIQQYSWLWWACPFRCKRIGQHLFRALQDANRLQILSRPQVMTLDTWRIRSSRCPGASNHGRHRRIDSGRSTNHHERRACRFDHASQHEPTKMALSFLTCRSNDRSWPEATGIPVGFSATGDVIRSPIINTLVQKRESALMTVKRSCSLD